MDLLFIGRRTGLALALVVERELGLRAALESRHEPEQPRRPPRSARIATGGKTQPEPFGAILLLETRRAGT